VPAIDGRLIGGMCSEPPLYPVKPPPPFGKLTVASTTVMAPANMSVISARYRPRSRSAGSPIAKPISIVTSPASITTTANGCPVPYSSRAPVQAPICTTAPWPREYRPTRPTSRPRPRHTTE
jgi:hypothetical protein